MANAKISEFSSIAADNTTIDGIDINEGCAPSGINNAIRELMAQLKDFQSGNPTFYTSNADALSLAAGGTGAITAESARTNLGVAKSGENSDITSLSGLTTPISVAQGGTGYTSTRTIATVARAANVVTITTTVVHGYTTNDIVTINAVTNTDVNTTTLITVTNSTQFTYTKAGADIASVADTGNVVSASNLQMANASGVLGIIHGGTGVNEFKPNNIIVGNGQSTPISLPAGTTSNVLTSVATSTVTAGSFVVGTEYTIASVGDTNWLAVGAASGTVGVVFTATTAGSGTGTATTNVWQSSVVPNPPKLSTATGSAPSYSARAFVNFNGSVSNDIACTFVRVGTTVTITLNSGTHPLIAGNRVYLDFASGVTDGVYTVTSVPNTSSFIVTSAASGSASGSVTVRGRQIRNGQNINYVSFITTGNFIVNFTIPMPDADYTVISSASASISIDASPAPEAASFVLQGSNSVYVNAVVFD
jgi:hypothetical protein